MLAVDAKTPSTLLAHKAGYIDQRQRSDRRSADRPAVQARHISLWRPAHGRSGPEGGRLSAPIRTVHEAFTKYRKTHNDGVFDAYTPEIMKCRKSGIITGLPDAYGRGRIIGDYRRVALYGVDRLLEAKRAERGADR